MRVKPQSSSCEFSRESKELTARALEGGNGWNLGASNQWMLTASSLLLSASPYSPAGLRTSAFSPQFSGFHKIAVDVVTSRYYRTILLGGVFWYCFSIVRTRGSL